MGRDWRPRSDLSQAGGGPPGNLCPILRPRSWVRGPEVEGVEGERGEGGGLRIGQQAVSLKWKLGQDMKRTWPGRGWTVRQGAILLQNQLEEREGCLSVRACMHVCVCLGLPRGKPHALMEGVADAISSWQGSMWVSLVGAQQKQHLQTHKYTLLNWCTRENCHLLHSCMRGGL